MSSNAGGGSDSELGIFVLWADKKLCLALWSAFTGHLYLADQKSDVLGSCIYTPEADSGCPWSGAMVCGVCFLLLNDTRWTQARVGVAWQVGTFDTGALQCAVELHTQALGCLLPVTEALRVLLGPGFHCRCLGFPQVLKGL